MKQRLLKNDLFQASQLTILISYSIFTVILSVETVLMSWDPWPLIPIYFGVFTSWILHIRQVMSEPHRVWVYTAFIMFTFFFYGAHITSVFDTVSVMALVLILFTMTGMKPLITALQILYYVTLGYGLIMMWQAGEEFNSLIISRSVLHIAVITTIGSVSRKIITKWVQVLDRSHDEIEQLTDSTERLNDFLANVSHEIRTPVNAVIGLTGICIDEETDPEKLSNLGSVHAAGRRVAEQIGDILDYTEIDRGKLTNNYEDYILSSLLNDLVGEIRPYKQNNLELIIDVDPSIPAIMNSDVTKLRKILRHLIINGLKYTREGGVYVRLSPVREEYGINLLIRVTDTGIGMNEEEIERVFEGYYQADSGRARQSSGLGLGMTIVSGFAESLGGFMTIESKPGAGTSVSVSIPQKVVEPSSCMSLAEPGKLCLGAFLHLDKYPNPNVREYYNVMIHNIVTGFGIQMHRVDNIGNLKKLVSSVHLTHLFVADEEYLSAQDYIEKLAEDMVVIVVANNDLPLPANTRVQKMEKPFYCFPVAEVLNFGTMAANNDTGALYCPDCEALVVDDEPMNLTVAKNILRRYGMKVTTAASGREAIDMCSIKRFDIVFMDHMMPGMDGVEAMKQIRAVRTNGDFPIVALTANAVSTAREMFLSVGFDGFVSKPIVLVELERVLRKVLPRTLISTLDEPLPDTEPEPESEVSELPAAEVPVPADPAPEETPAPEAPPVPEGGFYDKLSALGIDTAEGLGYCLEDEELYRSLLEQFVDEAEEKRSAMETYFNAKDLKNYEIYVHALKSTAKMLGHSELSEKAKALEFASKEDRADFVEENHAVMISEYTGLTDGIAAALSQSSPAEEAN
ncbi:MAG: response regulator [Ruminococcus sp.]|nr:response regulator [Ruminococcus sp.]